jgi:2-oxoglutarate ferredoxin oxidoreductase subunit delta
MTAHITIDEEWCKGCYLCVHYCKKKVFAKSKKRNVRGYTLPQITIPEDCTLCKNCEYICPEFAVTVEKGQEG